MWHLALRATTLSSSLSQSCPFLTCDCSPIEHCAQDGNQKDPSKKGRGRVAIEYPAAVKEPAASAHALAFARQCGSHYPVATLALPGGVVRARIMFPSPQAAASALQQHLPAVNGLFPKLMPWAERTKGSSAGELSCHSLWVQ